MAPPLICFYICYTSSGPYWLSCTKKCPSHKALLPLAGRLCVLGSLSAHRTEQNTCRTCNNQYFFMMMMIYFNPPVFQSSNILIPNPSFWVGSIFSMYCRCVISERHILIHKVQIWFLILLLD